MSEAQIMDGTSEAMRILHRLETGKIGVDEATRLLETAVEKPGSEVAEASDSTKHWQEWWLIPCGIGIGLTTAGAWLATLGGWLWLAAGPLLVIGISLMTLAATANRSPWVHLRIYTGVERWPRRVVISLPLPIRIIAWILQQVRPWMKGFEETGLDELLMSLGTSQDGLFTHAPISIEVEKGREGGRIEVYIG